MARCDCKLHIAGNNGHWPSTLSFAPKKHSLNASCGAFAPLCEPSCQRIVSGPPLHLTRILPR
ncbi:hypothetical protein FH972_023925 [Carpinus fangiana]|uniref:Uncharacterized protein n=1 Tax=Carpinus fangiana TaxID=176857 RepID=A0A5N6KWY5_9ROSI|nr:hypothetical protein FH972_023925 [Carpinus fangiana]